MNEDKIFRFLIYLNFVVIFCFVFDIFYYITPIKTVHCMRNFLQCHIINNYSVYYYGNVSFLQAQYFVNTFNIHLDILNLGRIHKYDVINGIYKNTILSNKNPLSHPQLQILNYTDLYPNLSVNFSSTSKDKSGDLFNLNDASFNDLVPNQFLFKNFYIYDSNFLTPQNQNYNNFLNSLETQKKLFRFFTEINKKYKQK